MSIDVPVPAGSIALVTGASGFTGQALVRKLCDLGVRVRAIARGSSDTSALKELPIDWVRGDVFDPEVVRKATTGVNYIFHVAAAYRDPTITDETYRQVHVVSTKLLAKAVTGSSDFRRFVHVSTVGVHGHIDQPPASEEYRFSPGDIYQATKAEGELWLREYAATNRLPYAVVRPAAIYGPGDRRLLKLFKLSTKRFFPMFGKGKGLYHLIHVDDLTDIFITAAFHPDAAGEAFIAGNPAPSSLREIATTVSSELGGRSVRFVRLPAWPLFAAAVACEALCKPFGIAPPIYRRRVAFFTKDRAFDTRKLQQRLGYRYSVPVERGIRETARWYREAGWL
jgi:nucleoside-diphosphate-sugar epimerase